MSEPHFTYNSELDKSVLRQGDLIKNGGALSELIGDFHKHYINPKYTHFQVLTQSCDLVKRGKSKKCSSRYITLAAVRSLDEVLKRSIELEAAAKFENGGVVFCNEKHKARLSHLISSLFNNNAKDYFFLKSSPKNELNDDSCTFLHLSIAIKTQDHYDLCLNEKCLELSDIFRSKLGWMVGNLYSRIGTEDYVPAALPDENSFMDLINETLNRHLAWVPSEFYAEFRSVAKPGQPFEEILKVAKESMEEKQKRRINNFTLRLEKEGRLNSDQVKSIKNFLNSEVGRQSIEPLFERA